MNRLCVFWDGDRVGALSRVSRREMVFRYDPGYLASEDPRPISLSLPLQDDPLPADLSRAWFANLLPEGQVRDHAAARLGVSPGNEFALLAVLGRDCAGALVVTPDEAPPTGIGDLWPLPWSTLERIVRATPRPSLLVAMMDQADLRLSLAGAQDKLPVRIVDGDLFLPVDGAPSTHLLKVARDDYPDLVPNELFCLMLARACGLPAVSARLAPTEVPILLVERYDRARTADGRVVRLHQEDLCQALGLPPETKYENEGGPSLVELFALLRRGSRRPLPDRRELLRWVIFDYLIGNTDAHAKNVSLLHGSRHDDRGPVLAPFYDLVCTEIYPGLSRKLAQKIGGEYRAAALAPRHWERLADGIGVTRRFLRSELHAMAERLEVAVSEVLDTFPDRRRWETTLTRIADLVRRRSAQVQAMG